MISKQLDKLLILLSPEEREATLSMLSRIFDNAVQHPDDDEHYQIKLTNITFTSTVWQYPAGQELMKICGWVEEGDCVRLSDDSCVHILFYLLKFLLSFSSTDTVPIPGDKFHILTEAFKSGDITCIKELFRAFYISPNGIIYSESGLAVNILYNITVAQQFDVFKLLVEEYSVDPYLKVADEDDPSCLNAYIGNIFYYGAQQSFIIAVLKYSGVKAGFRTDTGILSFT